MKTLGFFVKITIFFGFIFGLFNVVQALHGFDHPPKKIEVEYLKKALRRDQEQKMEFQEQSRKKKCYDLMMILDPDTEKKNTHPSMFLSLLQACAQASFPIIVSSSVMENYCLSQNGSTKLPDVFADDADLIRRRYPTDNDWYCYGHKTAPLLLLIPKKYIAQFLLENENLSIPEQLRLCGFDTSNIQAFATLLPDTVLSYIKDQGPLDRNIKASDIESLFLKPTQLAMPYAPSWNIYLDGHGHVLNGVDGKTANIAGLHENEFYELLKIFQRMKTSFLFYSTCYSAGQNLIKVQQELAKITANFMVATRGFNESAVSAGNIVVSEFFINLELFFSQSELFSLKMEMANWTKDAISFLVSPVIDRNALDTSQPWIYIPSTGVFNVFSLHESVRILTKSLVKAHELEGKTIDFTNDNIRTIIAYPQYVSVPVKIKAHVAIVSPTGLMIESEPVTFKKNEKEKEEDEQTWSPEQSKSNIIHFFEKIVYEDKLSSVIPNFISFQSSYFPIIFVFKELVCFDYNNSRIDDGDNHKIILKNVIVFNYQGNITVLFDYGDSVYSFSQKVDNLWKNSKELFKQFTDLPASKLDVESFNQLLAKSNLLKYCGLDENIKRSLEIIVHDIELKMDKNWINQESWEQKNPLRRDMEVEKKLPRNLPLYLRVKGFFKSASKVFSDMFKNAKKYIKQKMFLTSPQKKQIDQINSKQR